MRNDSPLDRRRHRGPFRFLFMDFRAFLRKFFHLDR